jgi:decaprenylphospho-beta-D-ribofuranose 2-oxidase
LNLGGWGRFPRIDTTLAQLRDTRDARGILLSRASLIARGNGRSYGDAALNDRFVLATPRCGRILDFDPASGRITCEAGLLLADLLTFAVPRGFFPPVTPGTKFVTIGGMIAADVHGKNHHVAGTFGRHLESLLLLLADGSTRLCMPRQNDQIFEATCGGMGLTGIILEATFRLLAIETPAIRQETLVARDFEEAADLCEASSGWTYSVAWIDCLARGSRLGRSLVYRGEHARRDELIAGAPAGRRRAARRVPFDLPGFALNRWSMRAFNGMYYRKGRAGSALVDYDSYFYPLDGVLEWNRIYGKTGFAQYQCVVPMAESRRAMRAILECVAASGRGSFLAVLKLFGPEGDGLISFPMEGYTLTLDFPVDADTLNLMLALDAIVADHGGRLYLAKDSRAGAAMMRRGYPRLARFQDVRRAVDPTGRFASLQSRRLGL